jgi:hypothetical protein
MVAHAGVCVNIQMKGGQGIAGHGCVVSLFTWVEHVSPRKDLHGSVAAAGVILAAPTPSDTYIKRVS